MAEDTTDRDFISEDAAGHVCAFALQILHGDDTHKKWLIKAADAYCKGDDIPALPPLEE